MRDRDKYLFSLVVIVTLTLSACGGKATPTEAASDLNGSTRSGDTTPSDEPTENTSPNDKLPKPYPVNRHPDIANIVPTNDPSGKRRRCVTANEVYKDTNQLAFILASALEEANYPDAGSITIYQSGHEVAEFNTSDGMPPDSLFGIKDIVACAQN